MYGLGPPAVNAPATPSTVVSGTKISTSTYHTKLNKWDRSNRPMIGQVL